MSKSILVVNTPKSCRECEYKCKIVENFLSNEKNDTYNALLFLENNRHPQCPLQDTTELLEALEILDDIYYKDELSGKPKLKRAYTVEEFSNHIKAYNKLHKAFGGQKPL